MHPIQHAVSKPDHPAIIMAESGRRVTYAELETAANQGAQLFRSLGLRAGDSVAFLCDNNPHFLEICWAAQRSGLYFTPLSTRLTPEEAAYIINDCGARAFIAS